jgi:hypothetical protein
MKSRLKAFLVGAALVLCVGSAFADEQAPPAAKAAPKPAPVVQQDHWPEGKLRTKTETTADGVKTVVHFDHDGTTQLLKQEFRKDGTLAYQKHRLLDGSTLAIRYKASGQPQMERTHNPKTGAFTLKHFRVGKSTSVWFRSEMNLNEDKAIWYYFGKNGTVKRVVEGDSMAVTVSDTAGKVEYQQQWSRVNGSWELSSATDPATSTRFVVTKDATGKAVQSAVELLKADGTLDRVDAGSQRKAPANWLEEYDPSDDPTIPQ